MVLAYSEDLIVLNELTCNQNSAKRELTAGFSTQDLE